MTKIAVTKFAPSHASGSANTVTVKSGDTLSEIARDHKVTVRALRAANPRSTRNVRKLAIGTVLTLPGSAGSGNRVVTKAASASRSVPKDVALPDFSKVPTGLELTAGKKSPWVQRVSQALTYLGFSDGSHKGDRVTPSFMAAVKKFQGKSTAYRAKLDGIAGKFTWWALHRASAKPAKVTAPLVPAIELKKPSAATVGGRAVGDTALKPVLAPVLRGAAWTAAQAWLPELPPVSPAPLRKLRKTRSGAPLVRRRPLLKAGSSVKPWVSVLQRTLNRTGTGVPLKIDGSFGKLTARKLIAVKKQLRDELGGTGAAPWTRLDGKVRPAEWPVLLKFVARAELSGSHSIGLSSDLASIPKSHGHALEVLRIVAAEDPLCLLKLARSVGLSKAKRKNLVLDKEFVGAFHTYASRHGFVLSDSNLGPLKNMLQPGVRTLTYEAALAIIETLEASRATGGRLMRPSRYDRAITLAAKNRKIDPAFVRSIVSTESAFNRHARSNQGAVGLMQVLPATAARMGYRKPGKLTEAWYNLAAGSKYVAKNIARFESLALAAAAHNAGEGAVSAYEGIPPFHETAKYVRKVAGRYAFFLANDLPKA